MPYSFNIVNGNRETHIPDKTHYTVTRFADAVKIEISPNGPELLLPRDADAVYVMNSKGDTVNSIKWEGTG